MSDAYDKAGDMPGNRLDKMRKGDPAEYMNAVHPNNHSRYVCFRVCARTEQDLRHWALYNVTAVRKVLCILKVHNVPLSYLTLENFNA